MFAEKTLVSIGMPVFNGENYMRQAIESVLCQDFGDFELIINDDCSSDHTAEIAEEYVEKDARVKFFRNDRNAGCSLNVNLTIKHMSDARFVAFIAHDDEWVSHFLSTLVPILEADDGLVAASGGIQAIDKQSCTIAERQMFPEFQGKDNYTMLERAIARFKLIGPSACLWLGLLRRQALDKTNLCFPGIHTHHVTIMTELACQGHFYALDETLYRFRKHDASRSQRLKKDSGFKVPRWVPKETMLAWVDTIPLTSIDKPTFRQRAIEIIEKREAKETKRMQTLQRREKTAWLVKLIKLILPVGLQSRIRILVRA